MEIHEYLEKEHIDKIYMLIIYDIKSDLNRTKFSKVLVRLYRLHGDGKIILFGNNIKIKSDDLIIV